MAMFYDNSGVMGLIIVEADSAEHAKAIMLTTYPDRFSDEDGVYPWVKTFMPVEMAKGGSIFVDGNAKLYQHYDWQNSAAWDRGALLGTPVKS